MNVGAENYSAYECGQDKCLPVYQRSGCQFTWEESSVF